MDRKRAALALGGLLFVLQAAGCGSSYLTSGKLYYKQKNWPKAAEQLALAVEQNPADRDGQLFLAVSLSELGRYGEAAAHFARARELSAAPAKLREVEDQQQHFFSALFNAGVTLANEKKFKEAAQEYEKAVQVKPEDPNGYRQLGYVYGQLQGTKEEREEALGKSVTVLRKATAMDPADMPTWMDLASSLRQAGRPMEAADAYKEAVAANPADPKAVEAWTYLGDVYYNAKDYVAAREAYVKATELRPDDPQLYFQIGLCDHNQEKFLDAMSAFQKAADYAMAAGRQDVYEDALYNAGLAAFKGQDHARAVEIAALLIEAKPQESSYYLLRGRSRSQLAKELETKGKRSESKKMSDLAIEDFKKAESLASSN